MQVDNPQETVEMIKQGDIDESLYSRQLFVLYSPFSVNEIILIM